MKTTMAVIAMILTSLLLLSANGSAQTLKKGSTLTIAGYPGEAQLVEINGKSYVDIQTLALITKGTLSFKANQTILTLHTATAEAQPSAPPAKPGLSRAFIQAGIEELSVIREWRSQIVNAVQTNTPLDADGIASRHRLAEKNLALAAAAVSSDDDRSAYPLLTAELNNMRKLSDAYLAMRQQAAFISPQSFGNGALEDQILSCAQGFTSMIESHEFQDQGACR
ncbi:MAG: hypothetical protein ABR905_14665 [Terracidiphilus sp.]|jgi:hypothetical protein